MRKFDKLRVGHVRVAFDDEKLRARNPDAELQRVGAFERRARFLSAGLAHADARFADRDLLGARTIDNAPIDRLRGLQISGADVRFPARAAHNRE